MVRIQISTEFTSFDHGRRALPVFCIYLNERARAKLSPKNKVLYGYALLAVRIPLTISVDGNETHTEHVALSLSRHALFQPGQNVVRPVEVRAGCSDDRCLKILEHSSAESVVKDSDGIVFDVHGGFI